MNPAQFARRQSHIISSRLLNVGRTQHMATVHNYDDKTDFDLDLSGKKTLQIHPLSNHKNIFPTP